MLNKKRSFVELSEDEEEEFVKDVFYSGDAEDDEREKEKKEGENGEPIMKKVHLSENRVLFWEGEREIGEKKRRRDWEKNKREKKKEEGGW